ncbi:MAG: type II secretion system protein [Candidatus Sungbacteria bacterium]|nr:type II secretion system protein [Candidatus Sungbacteria bacterium]
MNLSFVRRGTKGGFTLIELLVVIAIIGVLSSIVLASLNSARRKSRDARRITDIKQIQLALELYFDSQTPTPGYPDADTGAAACTATLAYGLEDLAPNYIPQVPRDPQGGCYLYATPTGSGVQASYHLAATLEDATNSALVGDRDCDSGIADGCGTVAYTGGFDGGVTVPDSTNRRYDVTP